MADPTTMKDDLLQGVSVDLRVCVGSAMPTVKELMELGPDSVLSLNTRIDDPVQVYVGDKLIARGFLEASGEGDETALAVRLTEIGIPSSGLQ